MRAVTLAVVLCFVAYSYAQLDTITVTSTIASARMARSGTVTLTVACSGTGVADCSAETISWSGGAGGSFVTGGTAANPTAVYTAPAGDATISLTATGSTVVISGSAATPTQVTGITTVSVGAPAGALTGIGSSLTAQCTYSNDGVTAACPTGEVAWTVTPAGAGTFSAQPANPITFTPSIVGTTTSVTASVTMAGSAAVTATGSTGAFTVPRPAYITYAARPSVSGSWLATLVVNDPLSNLQWTPGCSAAAGVNGLCSTTTPDQPSFVGTSPYNFIDRARPNSPTNRPDAKVPLYWGNTYEVRVGLVNTGTSSYCGSLGGWPTNTNGRVLAPTAAEIADAATGGDNRGCTNYLESGDTWTWPAPSQLIPRVQSASPAITFTTVANQGANENAVGATGPLVFTLRGAAAGSSATMTFTGVSLTGTALTTWQSSCDGAVDAKTFPCGRQPAAGATPEIISRRFNPDPQVWVISATGAPLVPRAATSVIGATTPVIANPVAPAPVIPFTNLFTTNDILVRFQYNTIGTAVAADVAAGIPAQPVLINVPSCNAAGTFIFNVDPAPVAPNTVQGINFFPTCTQGLIGATACTGAGNTNCHNGVTPVNSAQTAGLAIGNALAVANGPLAGVWIAQSPISIIPNSGGGAVLNAGNGRASAVTLSYGVGQATLPFTISLPLDASAADVAARGRTGVTIADNYWNTLAASGTNTGTVTVTPAAVYECADGATCVDSGTNNYVAGSLANFFGTTTPILTLSNAAPSATIAFTGLPQPTRGTQWRMFFSVTDANGVNAAAHESMPYLSITVNPIAIVIPNFPPADGVFYITAPATTAPSSYVYAMHIDRSPTTLGATSVTVNYAITGATDAITFAVNGSTISSFVFTGTQTTILFQIYTKQSAAGPFSITFTDAATGNSILTVPAGATNLYVRPNPISVKTLNSGLASQGPFTGEPFYFEAIFSPPAAQAFTITAAGGSISQTVTATVAAGDTGVLLGPVTAIQPSNIDLSAASYSLPIALTLSGAGSSAYSIPSIVAVNILRHTLVVSNALSALAADNVLLTVYTSGQPSVPFCITTGYAFLNNSAISSTDSLTLSLYSRDTGNDQIVNGNDLVIPGLLFEPSVVTLTKAAPRACVTVRADRNWNWESKGRPGLAGSELYYSVGAYLGGSLTALFQNPTAASISGTTENIYDFPHKVQVVQPQIQVSFESAGSVTTNTFMLGETTGLRISTDVLPPQGVNYTIVAPGVSFSQGSGASSDIAQGRFTTTSQFAAWNVTFNGLAGDISTPTTFARTISFAIYLSSSDAQFYRSWTAANPLLDQVQVYATSVTVVKRQVEFSGFAAVVATGVFIDYPSVTPITVRLSHPVVNGVTVTLNRETTGTAESQGLNFSQSVFTFTPGSQNSFSFTVTGQLLGTYKVYASLSGPDADIFDITSATAAEIPPFAVTVVTRVAPAVPDLPAAIVAGVTYGPLEVNFNPLAGQLPLRPGEELILTPSGADLTFSPASISFQPAQYTGLFSVVYTGTAATSRIFWTLSGSSAWKYSRLMVAARTKPVAVTKRAIAVDFGTGATTVGVTREGVVSIPFAPSAGAVTILPLVSGGNVTFNPAVWSFSATTGTTLHFTYTVSSVHAFALSSPANAEADQPATDGKIVVFYFLDGPEAPWYTFPQTNGAINVRRPRFHIDTTYNGAAKNPVEQPNTNKLFVVGKWSTWYSVTLSGAPATGTVTLHLTDSQNSATQDFVEFEVLGAASQQALPSSASLTFAADTYLQSFRFRFLDILSSDAIMRQVSVRVDGTAPVAFNAYDYTEIFAAFQGLQVVPALVFSPIPAIYTDGHADGLFVSLADALGNGAWPYSDDAQFTVHISVTPDSLLAGVVIEPSTLQFSKASLTDPLQAFRIVHTNPRVFGVRLQYGLQWLVRFGGKRTTEVVDITTVVPRDSQNVLLSRYQIIPKFPHVLSYGWQKASFNLSHIPLAHVSLTARTPPLDGSTTALARGATTPGGRIEFDPPTIVAAPGQQVVEFRVKAQPGVDRDTLYYRVDWTLQGHEDDLVNFVEYLQKDAANNGLLKGAVASFSTFHIASAAIAQASFALVLLIAALFAML